ncbi:HD domain-containing protein [Levilactobacillus spicheri]|uniref:Exopolyphosphatase n=2 Tax=Levilactobacillus spicheri TaxID=216463 RepID=A0A0F3RU72_9LACO|nr:HD domain-containing protein [Levilactobacillus spicheri]KJW13159.1 exopolyphosphatase [Levilactobacillus spicheri]KRL48321.1 exopolyphosphatase [Levilactobacillus spicheri DSM 15429]GEO66460.1 exopolyphosphatase [Levilactobacillus spicheri]
MADTYFGAILVNVTSMELSIVNLKTGQQAEHVKSTVAIGENIYNHEDIELQTVADASEALRGFLQIIKDYGVTHYKVWGSQALSAAPNADFIADQLYVRTGLRLNWISLGQESLVRNEAIALKFTNYKKVTKHHTAIIGLNSGSTTFSFFHHQKLLASHNMKLGPTRIKEVLQTLRATAPNPIAVLDDYINSKVDDFYRFVPDEVQDAKHQVILIGATPLNNYFIPRGKSSCSLTLEEFHAFTDEVMNASDQYLMEQLQLNEETVSLVLPEVLLLQKLFATVHANQVHLVNLNVLDGLTTQEAREAGYIKEDFDSQIIDAAHALADRYQVEPQHMYLVEKFALHLFDQLKSLHHLSTRDRLLLHVAAIVHDIGGFIDTHEHYLHSDYVLKQSELLGLSTQEMQIIAAVSRYHSSRTPGGELSRFRQLSTDERLRIAKLAALLRVADALDDAHQQTIERISVSVKPTQVVITCFSDDDLALVRWAFNFKADFFTDVFGLQPVFKQRRLHK